MANRGEALEELVIMANESYRTNKKAVIHKVPTEWKPIRGFVKGKYRIVSAKVEKQAAVDFLGHVKLKKRTLPLAFDVKEVSNGVRFPLLRVEPHQYDYLKDSAITGAFSFVLIAFWEIDKFYILPFDELDKRWIKWKKKTGPASVKAGESGLIEVKFTDYLNFLEGVSIV